MFGGLGMGEMVLIFLVVLLLFGAKRIPEIGTSLGSGIREFKKSMRDVETAALRPADNRYVPPPLPETPAFARAAETQPAAQIPAQATQAPTTPQA